MTRPDDIPQDLWEDACRLADTACGCAPGRRRRNGTAHSDDCWAQSARIARAIMAERARAAAVCRKAATYFDMGAGSAHSPEARKVAQAQCEWLASEIENPPDSAGLAAYREAIRTGEI